MSIPGFGFHTSKEQRNENMCFPRCILVSCTIDKRFACPISSTRGTQICNLAIVYRMQLRSAPECLSIKVNRIYRCNNSQPLAILTNLYQPARDLPLLTTCFASCPSPPELSSPTMLLPIADKPWCSIHVP